MTQGKNGTRGGGLCIEPLHPPLPACPRRCAALQPRAWRQHASAPQVAGFRGTFKMNFVNTLLTRRTFLTKAIGMFKPPFASFGRRGQAASSMPPERAFAPDPLGSPTPPVPPVALVEIQETPTCQPLPSTSSSACSRETRRHAWYANSRCWNRNCLMHAQGYGHDGAAAIKIHPFSRVIDWTAKIHPFFRVIDWTALLEGKVHDLSCGAP